MAVLNPGNEYARVMEHLSHWKQDTISKLNSILSTENYRTNIHLTNDTRIKYILLKLSQDESLNIIYPKVAPKNLEISRGLFIKASEYLQNNKLQDACEYYTASIAYAPPNTLAFGYDGRSDVLLNANFIKDSLDDINRALEAGYPDDRKFNLYLKKVKCLQALNPNDNLTIKAAIDEAEKWIPLGKKEGKIMIQRLLKQEASKKNVETAPYCYEGNIQNDSPILINENPSIPGLSDSVELRYSKEFGRHIVAMRDIKPGEILGVQMPYVAAINVAGKYAFCWHCKRQTWSGLPCPGCTQAIYCSESCRDEAHREYHSIECPVFHAIHYYKIEADFYLALKLTIIALKEANYSIDILKSNLKEIDATKDPAKKGFKNGTFQADNYAGVYTLFSNYPTSLLNCGSETLVNIIIIAYFIGKSLKYFSKNHLNTVRHNDKFIFLIEFVYSNYCGIFKNNLAFSFLDLTKNVKQYPSVVVPSLMFFNHSCDEMVARTYQNNRVVVTSIRPIKKNEQIFDNYDGISFLIFDKKIRQEKLWRLFNFICKCKACVEDWPLLPVSDNLKESTMCGDQIKEEIIESRDKLSYYVGLPSSHFFINNQSLSLKNEIEDLRELVEGCCEYFEKNNAVMVINAVELLRNYHILSQPRFLSLDYSTKKQLIP